MEIVNRQFITYGSIAEVIRFPMDEPGLKSAPAYQHRKAVRMMVSTIRLLYFSSLTERSATEFATPDNDRIIKQSALDKGLGLIQL